MAFYYLGVHVGHRGPGQSATRFANYISREDPDRVSGLRAYWDKSYAHGLPDPDRADLHEALARNMPSWAKEHPIEFWNAVDKYERANARLFVTTMAAIPKELSPHERVNVALGYADKMLGELYPFVLAVHEPGRRGKPDNPHFHLMWNERKLDGIERDPDTYFRRYNPTYPAFGGTKKEHNLTSRARIIEMRREWALTANQALEREGHEVRIDHRSLAVQTRDIDRERLQYLAEDTQRELAHVRQEVAREEQGLLQDRVRQHTPAREQRQPIRKYHIPEPEILRARRSRKLSPTLEQNKERSDDGLEHVL